MIRALLILPLLMLAGCGGPAPPVVDMAGVDGVAYNRDLSSCMDEVKASLFTPGNGVTTCIERRGYRILQRN